MTDLNYEDENRAFVANVAMRRGITLGHLRNDGGGELREIMRRLDEAMGNKPPAHEPCEQLPTKRVWIASKGTEKALTLLEADGWEVHEVVKAPVFRPNSPEDIRQSMDLLQKIHRESASLDASSGDTSVALDGGPICEDCPPLGYPTDKTRCDECPRHSERT